MARQPAPGETVCLICKMPFIDVIGDTVCSDDCATTEFNRRVVTQATEPRFFSDVADIKTLKGIPEQPGTTIEYYSTAKGFKAFCQDFLTCKACDQAPCECVGHEPIYLPISS